MARFSDCGSCGQPGRLGQFGQLGQASEAAGVTTTASSASQIPAWRSISLGLTTGLLIWFTTRFLDGKFTRKGK